jgi:hypothetical protein
MEIVQSLIEHFSWPLVVLLFMASFRSDLQAVLSRLKGLKAGSIELQLNEQLHAQGLTKQQLGSITSLTADELDLFLLVSFTEHVGFNYQTGLPQEVFKSRLLRLQEADLLQVLNPEDPGTNVRHNVTPLGRRLRAMLIGGSAQLLRGVK